MTRLQHRYRNPPIFIIIAGETDRLNELAESLYQLSQALLYLLSLLAQLVQLLTAIADGVTFAADVIRYSIETVLDGCQLVYEEFERWLNCFRSALLLA